MFASQSDSMFHGRQLLLLIASHFSVVVHSPVSATTMDASFIINYTVQVCTCIDNSKPQVIMFGKLNYKKLHKSELIIGSPE